MMVWGRVYMSTATWLFAAGPSGEGPAAQGPRARRNWPSPRASSSAPRPMLLPSPSPLPFGRRATPERGQMLRRAACQTASNRFPAAARVARPRAWISARRLGTPFGVRRPPWISFWGFTRAVASLLRRTGVDVCRLHVRSPGPWLGIPRAPLVLRTFPPRAGETLGPKGA